MKIIVALAVALMLSACAADSCWRQLGTDHPGYCR